MRCKKCNSADVKDWAFILYGVKGHMIHCVHCGSEYFVSKDEMARDLKEEKEVRILGIDLSLKECQNDECKRGLRYKLCE